MYKDRNRKEEASFTTSTAKLNMDGWEVSEKRVFPSRVKGMSELSARQNPSHVKGPLGKHIYVYVIIIKNGLEFKANISNT